jgi:glycosyltransferase involved in cell wall biosynthesis
MPATGPTLLDIAGARGVQVEVLHRGARHERRRRARELAALADRLGADLVHAYGAASAREAFWGPCRLGRRPLVHTVYEMAVPAYVYRATPLIVGTRYLLEDLESRGNVYLLSPPVDLERDAPEAEDWDIPEALRREPGLVHVVVVSRLDHEMKAFAIRTAIRALLRIPERNVRLTIVGGGSAGEELRAEGERVNFALGRHAVAFTGTLADPRPAYAGADVLLGMGGSAARSLAFAKPLIVTGERGWFQTFAPETSTYLFRQSFWNENAVEDPEAMFLDALVPLLDDEIERARLGANGRAFAEQNFGLEEMSRRLNSIYRHALRTYGRSQWLAEWRVEVAQAGRWLNWKTRALLPVR